MTGRGFIFVGFLCLVALTALNGCNRGQTPDSNSQSYGQTKNSSDMAVAKSAEITVGPFDLRRRYRSMEGPYCHQKIKIGELLEAGKLVVPESQITFVGSGAEP